MRRQGIALDGPEGQAVLVEIVFQMLEALEQDLSNPDICILALRFERDAAQAALELLSAANFADGARDLGVLGDAMVLIFAALQAATGDRADAMEILQHSAFARPGRAFQWAAAQLQLLMQEDSRGVMQRLFEMTLDGLDHPEIWPALGAVTAHFPDLIDAIAPLLEDELGFYTEFWGVIHALCVAASGEPARGWALLAPLATAHSQSTMTQGACFHIQSLLDPGNPIYDLESRFCTLPFDVFEVLDGKTHLCCASWLPESAGNLAEQSWEAVWNSDSAQSIRTSILDGSFRHCNKTACPKIAGGTLPQKAELASEAERWRDIIGNFRTRSETPPQRINLAYDQTCNLSCPSCRTGKVAADSATRARFDRLQDEQILPLLRHARLVLVTGSGDPFASKNFRNLLDRLGPEDYPDLRFQIMTNGMLFTPREWTRFPSLHGRVAYLRISLDAATGPTHELLRRGARWKTMEENLAFARDLRAAGAIDRLEFSFTVQTENYREMGMLVDMAHSYGADHIAFGRLTNWGTFSAEEYAAKAVFSTSHPQHGDFIEAMQDGRLRDRIAGLNDLGQFVRSSRA
ncbi:radical SAM protein [Rhizorhabdus dicambivorans]|uniref:Radical SAM protein n=2 Tax=Rhizorhabdus dicambivorans TaxID=1850238 RepID=A0A2A4G1P9_9SPHN|nr:radical SAM protein [Rhizorhabdus dicambivorans]PCE44411.1 radical SAM protein [Rhizorhabdus dicambivorans]